MSANGMVVIEVKKSDENDVGVIYELPQLQVRYIWIVTRERRFLTLQPMSGDYDMNADYGVVIWYDVEAQKIKDELEEAAKHG